MIPKRMIEKKMDLAKLSKYYFNEWKKRVDYLSGKKVQVNLNKDITFIINLKKKLDEMGSFTDFEKEKIMSIGRDWLLTNGVRMCSVINFTEQELKDLTTSEIQCIVGDVVNGIFERNTGLDILKVLYKARKNETVEALQTQVKAHILSINFHDLRQSFYCPDRLIKMMCGKDFCKNIGVGWVTENKNYKTLEEELDSNIEKYVDEYNAKNKKVYQILTQAEELEEAEQSDEYCGDQPWFDEDRICQEMGCDEIYVGDGMWWDNVNKRHYCEK